MKRHEEGKARLILDLRRGGIEDTSVMEAMEAVPRELFVPEAFREHAYENAPLPIGKGQTISQPLVVATMTQALKPDKRKKVLEIGTGSGYQACVLSLLFRRVYSIERHRELLREAEARFRQLDLYNVVTKAGDGGLGWIEQAPFERIMVTAAAHDVPPILVDQLAIGGIMIVPVGDQDDVQTLLRVVKTEDGVEVEDLGGVRFVPMLPGDPSSLRKG